VYEVQIQPGHFNAIAGLLDAIEKDPNAEEFMEPVDWQALELHSYPQVISKMMDLGTLRKNLHAGQYTTYEALLRDLQLIWDNCKLFNYPGMYKLANCMEKTSKKEIKKFIDAMALYSVNVPAPANLPPPMKRKRSSLRAGLAKPERVAKAAK
jgi:hypothetical protein